MRNETCSAWIWSSVSLKRKEQTDKAEYSNLIWLTNFRVGFMPWSFCLIFNEKSNKSSTSSSDSDHKQLHVWLIFGNSKRSVFSLQVWYFHVANQAVNLFFPWSERSCRLHRGHLYLQQCFHSSCFVSWAESNAKKLLQQVVWVSWHTSLSMPAWLSSRALKV